MYAQCSPRTPPLFGRQTGFTLIEVMVAIGILAILAGLAAPSFRATIERYQIRTVREDLTASIYLARSEAIRRGSAALLACEESEDCAWTITFVPESLVIQQSKKNSSVTAVLPADATFDRWGYANACLDFKIEHSKNNSLKQNFHLTPAGAIGEGACV